MTAAAPSSVAHGRRILLLAAGFGFPFFLAVLAILPNLGPVFRLFDIPSSAMAPTLMPGQFIIVSRASYGYSRYSFDNFSLPVEGRWPVLLPKRGDVVVFRHPRHHEIFYVKRLVGLPGDRIQMIGGALNINGVPLKRDRVEDLVQDTKCGPKEAVHRYRETMPDGGSYLIQKLSETCRFGRFGAADDTEVFVVPPKHYFVMGDNRDDSADSRFTDGNGVGYLPEELILGRAVLSF